MQPRTCSNCAFWTNETCRVGWPTAFLDGTTGWPKTTPTDWCHHFKSAQTADGTPRKFSDDNVLGLLREFDLPEEGKRVAVQRKFVVDQICEKYGVSSNPVMKRLEKLERMGLIGIGPDPWPENQDSHSSGIHLWLETPEEKTTETEGSRGNGRPMVVTADSILAIVLTIAPTMARPASMRAIHRAVAATTKVSLPTIGRRLDELMAAGKVLAVEGGYCAAPQPEVGT